MPGGSGGEFGFHLGFGFRGLGFRAEVLGFTV